MSQLPPKPKYGEACNGCGLCCSLELCHVAKIVFKGAQAPCPGLKLSPDGSRTYCELVLVEKMAVENGMVETPLIAIGLGIGNGCSMEDETKRECDVPDNRRTVQFSGISLLDDVGRFGETRTHSMRLR